MFLIGDGFTKDGQFPFIDEFDLKTLKTKRLYQSAYTTKKEDIFSIEDFKSGLALVQIQSKNEFPNFGRMWTLLFFYGIGEKSIKHARTRENRQSRTSSSTRGRI